MTVFLQGFLADSFYFDDILNGGKIAVIFAPGDDGFGFNFSDTGKRAKLGKACLVYVYNIV